MPDASTIDEHGRYEATRPRQWRRVIGVTGWLLVCLNALVAPAGAEPGIGPSAGAPPGGDGLARLERRVQAIWGRDNAWMPSATVWVQYEPDLGERSAVDFANGEARVQILLRATDDPGRHAVRAHLRQGVGNLVLGAPTDPVEMVMPSPSVRTTEGTTTSPAPGREVRVYLVRPGDSLWKIARQFDMPAAALAKLNGLDMDAVLPIGRPLKVIVLAYHDLTLDPAPHPQADHPLLLDQIRMADGSPVPPWMVRDFAAEVVGTQPLHSAPIVGADGIERLAVTATFRLVADHLEVRARKFHPLVRTYAAKMNLDPALIMAIIHTESMFNPRARSDTPAFGLMQLVPHTAGREAYRTIYGQRRQLTAQYLYDPENNIELGAAYFSILKNKYMKSIVDPTSRRYCAVAAYNAGASNVGTAFISRKSIRQAIPVINDLDPNQVYARLVHALPMSETRAYVRNVLNRIRIYRDWR